jgi:predicted GNAT family N-acyltransferase
MPAIMLIEASSAAERALAFEVRRRVFVSEQGIAERLEFDADDAKAAHLLALSGEDAVGTLRVRVIEDGRTAKIERVAVVASARGTGVGLRLVQGALDLALRQGAERAVLHAQTRAMGFYARLGFAAFGPEFVEDGIMHVAMERAVGSQRSPASTVPSGERGAPR